MATYSLEDEDYNELFITQTPKENLISVLDNGVDESEVFEGIGCGKGDVGGAIYEDISDVEDTNSCGNIANFK